MSLVLVHVAHCLSLLILCSLSTLLSIDSAEQLIQMTTVEFLLPNDCKLCISGILFLDGGHGKLWLVA